MKGRNTIGSLLFKNYIIIFIIAIATFFLAQFVSNFIIKTFIYNYISMDIFHPQDISEYPYDNINIKQLETMNSWIEVLNENKDIVFVKGKKQDDIYHYEERMLYEYSSKHDYSKQYPFHYNIYPVNGPSNKPYLLIWKLPKKIYNTTYNLKIEQLSQTNNFQLTIYGIFIGVFLLLFSLSLYLYSKYTSKYFKKPLLKLISGIKEMEKRNYNTRLNFKTQKEFGEIRDAFNNMATHLEKAEIEKKRLSESKQQMLVDISHDLKTPITSIYGFSKLLYDKEIKSNEERKKYLKIILNKSRYVTNLIEDLFQLSKLENNNYKLNLEKVDYAEWFRQLISELYPEFEKKNFHLNIGISEEPMFIYIDTNYMKRVILNIVSNIFKYNVEGTEVYLGCYSQDDTAVINIGDNGVGIDDDLRKIIFSAFVRGDKSRKSEDGTGLGLAISKKIIEKHNGVIELSSNDMYITAFTIKLPIERTSLNH